MKQPYNSFDLIKTSLKWWKQITLVTVISLAAGIIFSAPYFIPPQYKSIAVLYPVNLSPYGEESTTEQMLQILNSEEISNALIRKYNLLEHYDISPDEEYPRTLLLKKLEKNISFEKTEFESVQIEVWDTDRNIASDMVLTIIDEFNSKARKMQREKSNEVVKVAEFEMLKKKKEMDSLENVLKEIRVQYGIINYDAQSKVVTKEYLKAIGKNDKYAIDASIDPLLKGLKERGGEFISISEHLYRVRGTYNDLKIHYETALKEVNKVLTYENIVTHPYPAEKKSYPIRWLFALIAGFSGLFLSLVTVFILENYKSSRTKFVKEPILQSINDN
jgi:uncharacterized protein involved in exopolysaccharide biosynthesis